MSRACPNCGASSAPEARFCRLCGAWIKAPDARDATVTPGAETVPLSDEGRTTHALSTENGGGASAPETSRVRRAELDHLLRRPPTAPTPPLQEAYNREAAANGEATAAPATNALAGGPLPAAEDSSPALARSEEPAISKEAPSAVVEAIDEGRGAEAGKTKKSAGVSRRKWMAGAIALFTLAAGAVALLYYSRWRATSEQQSAQPTSAGDQKRLVQEKLAEAETLLAKGNVSDAMARLRQVLRVDPSNARAHRLLAEALERTGAVTEAIDEYRAATQSDPGNEETWLRYADALRRVGRTDEAREIYQRLSGSASEEVSRTAKEQLAALPPSPSEQSRDDRAQNRPEENGNGSAAAAAQPPNASTQPGSQPSSSASGRGEPGSGRAKNDPATSYNTAMRIIEGKDIRKMNRAELIRAYELFQYAQTGPNGADATRRLRELDKELFERRRRK